MTIGVHGKEFSRELAPFIETIFFYLNHHKVRIIASPKFKKLLKGSLFKPYAIDTFSPGEKLKGLDLFLSLGGDGTLLESVTYVGNTQIPILGINTGRLGFLATISRNETENALEKILLGQYRIDQRSLLKLKASEDFFEGLNFALNDFTVMKKDTSSMITVHVEIDGEFLNSYWSDGIIVATPTGSTGYSLSCGGPLVFPRSGNFVITPVSPHNLTVRPIIISDDCEIKIRVEGRSKKFLASLDSRMATIGESVELRLMKADFMVNLIELQGNNYFKTLRQKLNWGLDIRN